MQMPNVVLRTNPKSATLQTPRKRLILSTPHDDRVTTGRPSCEVLYIPPTSSFEDSCPQSTTPRQRVLTVKCGAKSEARHNIQKARVFGNKNVKGLGGQSIMIHTERAIKCGVPRKWLR
ncbi:hypothetical protein PILCRDRAFT_414331 [Piloderma croceum F 1598]|uniref:Uncharacterized protein n=1 Tax=Piloderma croceum (strain F 1598) TaxID=765440 RepID=A0A0C3FHE6_PILCF|nr:hypothetical protein PILCRDRAFT_414331 [Piloderma croceum F 1598]